MSTTADTITLTLPPEVRAAMDASVAAGEFASVEEAVGDAIALWREQREENVEALRQMVQRSLDDPRPDIPMDEAFDRVEARLRARSRAA